MRQYAAPLAACALLGACASSSPPPRSTPLPTTAGDVRVAPLNIARGWASRASVVRNDSIVITLPSGARQVQRQGQRAQITVDVGANGELRLVLDSLTFSPTAGNAEIAARGTVWTGLLGRDGVGSLRPSKRSPIIDEFTTTLESIFPAIPRGGVRPGMTWTDTLNTQRRVQAFDARDRRITEWTGGKRTTREGIQVQPVTATATFEQLGDAETGGQRMNMTAQGRRMSTYYMTVTGRIEAVAHQDSIAMLITIPARGEAIPTMQQIRTTIRFLPPR